MRDLLYTVVLVTVLNTECSCSLSDSFDISLTCGCEDVALDMCVRFEDREILRNACVSDSWGEEERSIPYFPFIAEQPFRVSIICLLHKTIMVLTKKADYASQQEHEQAI